MPCPRSRNNVFEFWKFWFPAEFTNGLFGGRNEFWWIAWTALFFNRRNFFAGDFFAHLNDLFDGIAIAISQIIKSGFARRESENMRLRQILDVDVIADARAVGRR